MSLPWKKREKEEEREIGRQMEGGMNERKRGEKETFR